MSDMYMRDVGLTQAMRLSLQKCVDPVSPVRLETYKIPCLADLDYEMIQSFGIGHIKLLALSKIPFRIIVMH